MEEAQASTEKFLSHFYGIKFKLVQQETRNKQRYRKKPNSIV